MWMSKKKWNNLNEKIAALEKGQLRIKEYIAFDKKLHEDLDKKIDSIPEKLLALLNKNS